MIRRTDRLLISHGEAFGNYCAGLGIKHPYVDFMAKWLDGRRVLRLSGSCRAGKTTVLYTLVDFEREGYSDAQAHAD